jgi:hypothetical protein
MLFIEMARAIEADRDRQIEKDLERRRLLRPEEAPDSPPAESIRRRLASSPKPSRTMRPARLVAIDAGSPCIAGDCGP